MLDRTFQSVSVNDPETGSALALFLTAAGYEVETDFFDGSVFISAEAVDPEIRLLDGAPHWASFDLACQLRERLDNPVEEAELPALRSEFHHVA